MCDHPIRSDSTPIVGMDSPGEICRLAVNARTRVHDGLGHVRTARGRIDGAEAEEPHNREERTLKDVLWNINELLGYLCNETSDLAILIGDVTAKADEVSDD